MKKIIIALLFLNSVTSFASSVQSRDGCLHVEQTIREVFASGRNESPDAVDLDHSYKYYLPVNMLIAVASKFPGSLVGDFGNCVRQGCRADFNNRKLNIRIFSGMDMVTLMESRCNALNKSKALDASTPQ